MKKLLKYIFHCSLLIDTPCMSDAAGLEEMSVCYSLVQETFIVALWKSCAQNCKWVSKYNCNVVLLLAKLQMHRMHRTKSSIYAWILSYLWNKTLCFLMVYGLHCRYFAPFQGPKIHWWVQCYHDQYTVNAPVTQDVINWNYPLMSVGCLVSVRDIVPYFPYGSCSEFQLFDTVLKLLTV